MSLNDDIKRTRTISWEDPKISTRNPASVSGLDYLKAVKDEAVSSPPIARLVGYQITDVETGSAAFEIIPGEHLYNPFSTVHGGILSTLLDTTMTSSVMSTLSKGLVCATVEIKVNFIKPVTEKTGLIRCEARPIHVGKRLATVEGRVADKEGSVLAHGVSTCAIFKVKR